MRWSGPAATRPPDGGRLKPRSERGPGAESSPYARHSFEGRAATYDARRFESPRDRFWHEHDLRVLDGMLPVGAPGLPTARLLDVGCGTGRLAIPLCTAHRTIVGLDRGEAMLRQAVGKGLVLGTRSSWVRGSAEQLPFARATFDGAYAVRFLNLFSEDEVRPLCAELERVVRPGGVIVAHFSNALYGLGVSLVRRRTGGYRKELLWPGRIARLFPACRVERSIGTHLPFQSQLLPLLGPIWSRRLSTVTTRSALRYLTHTRFFRLVRGA